MLVRLVIICGLSSFKRVALMAVYFSKSWWSGDSRDEPGTQLDLDWPLPVYRPGWTIRYMYRFKEFVGKLRYVQREGPNRLDFYVSECEGALHIVFGCNIKERIEKT